MIGLGVACGWMGGLGLGDRVCVRVCVCVGGSFLHAKGAAAYDNREHSV